MNDNNLYQGQEPDGTPTASYDTDTSGTSGSGRRIGRGKKIAGVALAGVLAGGAAFAAVSVVGGSPAAVIGPTGQAAVLNSALTSASTTVTGATAAKRHLRDPLARLRRLGGIDGEFTFETKTGPRTVAFERGTVTSVADGDVVVRATNGTTWAWKLVSDTVVRTGGKKTTESALSAGDLVFVGGPVLSGSHDARLIVIRTPKSSGSAGTSSSTGTSVS
jgi:hypothetical protein